MVDASDLRTMQLFDESTIDAYGRIRYAKALEAVLAETGWSLTDVVALSDPFNLLVIARAGLIECSEPGVFKKRLEVGTFLRWGDIINVAQTEPGLRIFGIDVTEKGGGVRAFKWSGGGSRQCFAERNRIYDSIAACMGV